MKIVRRSLCWILGIVLGGAPLSLRADTSIGFIAPLTGVRAPLGADGKAGAELARSELSHDPASCPLTLAYEDSQGDPVKGIAAYRALVSKGARIVVTQNSNVSVPIAQIVNGDGVIQMATATTSDSYSRPHDLTFRVNGPSKDEAVSIAAVLAQKANGKEISFVVMDDEYATNLERHIRAQLESKGLSIVSSDTYSPGEVDFRAILTRLRGKASKNIMIIGYPVEAGFFVKQLRELGLSPALIMGNMAIRHDDFTRTAGKAAEGVYATYAKVDLESKVAKEFEERNGRSVNFLSASAYDAIKVLESALRSCGCKDDSACLKEELFALKHYSGLTGSKGFDDTNGDMTDSYQLLQVRNDSFVVVE